MGRWPPPGLGWRRPEEEFCRSGSPDMPRRRHIPGLKICRTSVAYPSVMAQGARNDWFRPATARRTLWRRVLFGSATRVIRRRRSSAQLESTAMMDGTARGMLIPPSMHPALAWVHNGSFVLRSHPRRGKDAAQSDGTPPSMACPSRCSMLQASGLFQCARPINRIRPELSARCATGAEGGQRQHPSSPAPANQQVEADPRSSCRHPLLRTGISTSRSWRPSVSRRDSRIGTWIDSMLGAYHGISTGTRMNTQDSHEDADDQRQNEEFISTPDIWPGVHSSKARPPVPA